MTEAGAAPKGRESRATPLRALADGKPLLTLAGALLELAAKDSLDADERLVHAVLIDSLCARCPAAQAAFDAWAESDDIFTDDDGVIRIIEAVLDAEEEKEDGT